MLLQDICSFFILLIFSVSAPQAFEAKSSEKIKIILPVADGRHLFSSLCVCVKGRTLRLVD